MSAQSVSVVSASGMFSGGRSAHSSWACTHACKVMFGAVGPGPDLLSPGHKDSTLNDSGQKFVGFTTIITNYRYD